MRFNILISLKVLIHNFPNIGMVRVEGIYNSTDSTYKIAMRIRSFEDETSIDEFIHSPIFGLDEWVYIGVSIFKTNRFDSTYNIHIVSKTYFGVENLDSFLSQSFQINKYIESYPRYMNGIGSIVKDEKMKFTGIFI